MANVDMDENLIRVMGKGKKERIVPFGDIAKNVLNDYINMQVYEIFKEKFQKNHNGRIEFKD